MEDRAPHRQGTAADTPVLEMRGVTKRFGAVVANDDISLSLGRGEVLGLLGENGAGKSTLMKILFGLYTADSGEVLVDGAPVRIASPRDAVDLRIGMVHQHFVLVGPLSVAENVVLGAEPGAAGLFDRGAAEQRVADLAARYGLAVDPSARVGDLSVGVQQRVEILKALYREARILILDEPTAVLTPQESHELFRVLRGLVDQGLSIILITHKLGELKQAADRITVIRDGRVIATVPGAGTSEGELARLMVGREVKLAGRRAAAALGVTTDAAEEPAGGADAAGPGGATAAGAATAGGGATAAGAGAAAAGGAGAGAARAGGVAAGAADAGVPAAAAAGGVREDGGERPVRLSARGLVVAGVGGATAVHGVDLAVRGGEILAIAGVDGNGQVELAEALAGTRPARAGVVELDGPVVSRLGAAQRGERGLAYIPEDRSTKGLVRDFTVAENMTVKTFDEPPFSRLGWLRPGAIRRFAARLVQAFDVRPADPDARAGSLSGGNQQKAVVARELTGEPGVVIAAQPTRGVDVGAIEFLHARLLAERDRGAAILLLSLELDEIRALADRILVIAGGRVVGELDADRATDEQLGLLMAGREMAPVGGALDPGDAAAGGRGTAADGHPPGSAPL